MVEPTIDKIKDITVERQIRKLAGIIDEQNQKIDASVDFSTDIKNLQDSDANQTNQINNLKSDVAKNTTATENLNNRVTSVEQNTNKNTSDITSVKSAITNIQSKDVAQDGVLSTHSEQIQGITESLVSDVQIIDGTTTGEIKVRIDRESAAAIDSNSYNLGLPVSAEIIQGTGPSMFKVQITMSSGVKVVSNDFVFTTEAIGNDVYISSFTFKSGSQNGYLSADIGLNNGVTIEANNFLVPTDPNVIANITDLQTRMTNVENSAISDSRITAIETKNTEQDNKISAIEAKNTSQDTAIQKNATDINSLNTEVSGVMSDLGTKVAISQGTGNAGKVLGIGSDGNVTPTEVSAGGEVWEVINPANLPTDWVDGDRIKICVDCSLNISPAGTWSSPLPSTLEIITGEKHPQVIELSINENGTSGKIPVFGYSASYGIYECVLYANGTPNTWNTGDYALLIFRLSFTNGSGCKAVQRNVQKSELSSFVYKMWRLKK